MSIFKALLVKSTVFMAFRFRAAMAQSLAKNNKNNQAGGCVRKIRHPTGSWCGFAFATHIYPCLHPAINKIIFQFMIVTSMGIAGNMNKPIIE